MKRLSAFFYEKIWKDSVLSKLFAEGLLDFIKHFWPQLITLGGSTVGSVVFWEQVKAAASYLITDPWRIAAVVLVIAVLILTVLLFRQRPAHKAEPEATTDHKPTPLEWLLNADLNRYRFLLWFAAKRTRRTETYRQTGLVRRYGDVSFDGVPEVRRLLDKDVLSYKHPNRTEYCLEIDDEVLQYLEEFIEQTGETQEAQEALSHYRKMNFSDLFPQAKTRWS